MSETASAGTEVAIIGIAGRFAGASDLNEFWQQQENGVEAISFFSDEQLIASGINSELLANPSYIRARAVLDNVELFDANFFGFTPRQAEIADPQQRIFLECAWEALENAGYDSERCVDRIGVFAGASMSSYFVNLYSNPDLMKTVGGFQAMLGNDKDFLATLACYKLNLKGPGMTIQSACSTSLVALHVACQHLLGGDCDMALAGGVSINLPQESGYLYQEGGIHSPDGHCRPFDVRACGTVGGNGAGLVVLKRLKDALRDRDTIRGVIKGSAINNDGSLKPGFSAPGYAGQTRVIRDAYAVAGVRAEEISYIETHGTGTVLGDQIEISALISAFREQTEKTGFCALGSVKANTGHLDAAAGIVSLIRTVLALERRRIPPCVHFQRPNPNFHLDTSPFFVPSKAMEWSGAAGPRRAGVSSFGIGGTNVHVVLEEAPQSAKTDAYRRWLPILLSAKTPEALDAATVLYSDHLYHTKESFADISYTLHAGRRAFGHCRLVVSDTAADAGAALLKLDSKRVHTAQRPSSSPFVVFLFPGGGAQYPGMAQELYHTEVHFRSAMDRCFDISRSLLKFDLKEALWPPPNTPTDLSLPSRALPALFAVEYALAAQWIQWDIRPDAVLGHSLGEYVAACVAGIMSLEDSLRLVIARGVLLDRLSHYQMLSVPLSEQVIRLKMPDGLAITAINAPDSCVIAGSGRLLADFEALLQNEGVEATWLKISTASHCEAVDAILPQFAESVSQVARSLPKTPCLSNVTGDWISGDDIRDHSYWSRHLRQTVRFSDCIARLEQQPDLVLLEVGPGRTLGSLAKLQLSKSHTRVVTSSLRHALDDEPDGKIMAECVGRLWAAGVPVNCENYYSDERRFRVPLPTYPFQRSRHWVEAQRPKNASESLSSSGRRRDISRWFFTPSWKRSWSPRVSAKSKRWLVFADMQELAENVIAHSGELFESAMVWPGNHFEHLGPLKYRINPHDPKQYLLLLKTVLDDGFEPAGFAHFWSIGSSAADDANLNGYGPAIAMGYYSALYLSQAVGKTFPSGQRRLVFFTDSAQEVTGADILHPEQASLLGLSKVIPQEYPNLVCASIDTEWSSRQQSADQGARLAQELGSDSDESAVAYRGGYRWIQIFEPLDLTSAPSVLRERGIYILIGGLGRIGLRIARHLAETRKARVVLIGRRSWPPRDETVFESCDIEAIKESLDAIRAAGGEAFVISADAADPVQMQSAFDAVKARFGPAHGVLHLPTVSRETSLVSLHDCGPENTELHFRGKVKGTYVLARLLDGQKLDFCIMFSSLSSFLGGLGFGAYAAASTFQDAFAHWRNLRSTTPWISINWEGWKFETSASEINFIHRQSAAYALSPEDGIRAFEQIMSSQTPTQFAISTVDLRARARQSLTVKGEPSKADSQVHSMHQTARRERALANPMEELIARIWAEHLGMTQIESGNNFFALGGTSLLATYCMARMSESLGIRVPLKMIFEAPRLCDLAQSATELVEAGSRSEAAVQ